MEDKIAGKLLEKQRKEYENKLEHLKNIKKEKGKSAAIFKLKEKVIGSKKEGMESVSMKDPVTGSMICDPEQLKKASTEYLSKLLTNRDPKDGYQRGFETLRLLHDLRMSEELENEEKLTYQDFENMLKKMKKKKAGKYKFILNACLKRSGNLRTNQAHGNTQTAPCSSKGKDWLVNLETRGLFTQKMKFQSALNHW